MQWRLSSLSLPIDESSDGGLVTSISTFLELDGVDLLFDEPHLGGKDNLPRSVITIVHQQKFQFLNRTNRCSDMVACGV